MVIATLISDWGTEDPYVGMFKGRLLSEIKDIQSVDITHHIKTSLTDLNIPISKIEQTAFILKKAYQSFPQKTLHFILTETSLPKETKPILVFYDNHYFITNDNGCISLMFGNEQTYKALTLIHFNSDYFTDKMIELAKHVDQIENSPEIFETVQLSRRNGVLQLNYECEPDTDKVTLIRTQVAYIDNFKNIICNIQK